MATRKGAFKNKGTGILKTTPSSMDEFLKDTPGENTAPEPQPGQAQGPGQGQDAQIHISTNPQKAPTKETERFHLNIRKDLADRVFDEILKRKRTKNGKKATQTAIFEEVLESYLS